MATTIGGTAVVDPEYDFPGEEIAHVDSSILLEMADGTLVAQHTNSRKRINLKWQGLTSAELATLEGAVEAAKGVNTELVTPYFAAHLHVFAVPNTFKASYIQNSGGTMYWKAEASFVEVA
jgi:hypothetical protein